MKTIKLGLFLVLGLMVGIPSVSYANSDSCTLSLTEFTEGYFKFRKSIDEYYAMTFNQREAARAQMEHEQTLFAKMITKLNSSPEILRKLASNPVRPEYRQMIDTFEASLNLAKNTTRGMEEVGGPLGTETLAVGGLVFGIPNALCIPIAIGNAILDSGGLIADDFVGLFANGTLGAAIVSVSVHALKPNLIPVAFERGAVRALIFSMNKQELRLMKARMHWKFLGIPVKSFRGSFSEEMYRFVEQRIKLFNNIEKNTKNMNEKEFEGWLGTQCGSESQTCRTFL